MIKVVLLSLLLYGSCSNNYGRAGILLNSHGRINTVLKHSPAHDAGLLKGDIVLEADGKKGYDLVDGMAGTLAAIKIKRGKEVLMFYVVRAPKSEVY